LWIIIDTDWKIYITNIFINEWFEKYKKELEIWDVKNWFYVDITGERIMKWCVEKIWEIVNNGYNRRVLKSVKYVNLILNNFCNEFKTYRA
jgi:hypothetical protein